MKKDLDFYEFTGVLLPGIVVLGGISLLYNDVRAVIWSRDFSIGEFGLVLLLSYVAGQLLQAIGNIIIEPLWWRLAGGMPTDWIRTGNHFLIGPAQSEQLELKINSVLGLGLKVPIRDLSRQEWSSITGQLYAALKGATATGRVDIFNGNYGLHRGLAAAFLFLLSIVIIHADSVPWQLPIWLVVGVAISAYRMNRFAQLYGREIFLQFLQLK